MKVISEIVAILKQLPTGSLANVRDFAQAELNRLKGKHDRRRRDWENRRRDQDPPMYRNGGEL